MGYDVEGYEDDCPADDHVWDCVGTSYGERGDVGGAVGGAAVGVGHIKAWVSTGVRFRRRLIKGRRYRLHI